MSFTPGQAAQVVDLLREIRDLLAADKQPTTTINTTLRGGEAPGLYCGSTHTHYPHVWFSNGVTVLCQGSGVYS